MHQVPDLPAEETARLHSLLKESIEVRERSTTVGEKTVGKKNFGGKNGGTTIYIGAIERLNGTKQECNSCAEAAKFWRNEFPILLSKSNHAVRLAVSSVQKSMSHTLYIAILDGITITDKP